MKTALHRVICLTLGLLMLLCGLSAFAASDAAQGKPSLNQDEASSPVSAADLAGQEELGNLPSLIAVEHIGKSSYLLKEDGSFVLRRQSEDKRYKKERIRVSLRISPQAPLGEEAVLTLKSDGFDFDYENAYWLARRKDELLYARAIPSSSSKNCVVIPLKVDSAILRPEDSIQSVELYIEGARNGSSDTSITATLSSPVEEEFRLDNYIEVRGYQILKQGDGVGLLQGSHRMQGMTVDDTVYVIYQNYEELMRVIVSSGEVIGIAKYDGEKVVALEYDFKNKVYRAADTGKAMLKRGQVLSAFDTLDFSFMQLPDEEAWMQMQDRYKTSVSVPSF
jgi:hypothetical protein